MSEKKYTEKELAIAVLKKCAEMYKSSDLFKTNTAHEIEDGQEPDGAGNAECPEQLQAGEATKPEARSVKSKKKKPGEAGEEESEENEEVGEEDKEHEESEDGLSEGEEEETHEIAEDEAEEEVDEHEDEMHEKEPKKEDKKDKKTFGKSEQDVVKADEFDRQQGQRGVHHGEPTRDKVIENPERSYGQSYAGVAAKKAKKFLSSKNPHEIAHGKALMESAKREHKHVISEQKQMSKPNLPKSENEVSDKDKLEKRRKGGFGGSSIVNTGLPKEKSDSDRTADALLSITSSRLSGLKAQKEQKIKEQKEMPKPNLPKSEKLANFISKRLEKRGKSPVGKKISKLVVEGKPQKQAIAMALEMKRKGRLTPEGGYKRVKKQMPSASPGQVNVAPPAAPVAPMMGKGKKDV